MSLQSYAEKFTRLKIQGPHKICMLLGLLDLARSGSLLENKIYYDAKLLERYSQYFDAVRSENNHSNPYFPFFHLSGKLKGGGESFWHLKAIEGRESFLESIDSARGHKTIQENIDYAYLDDELFELLKSEQNIDVFSQVLSESWLDRQWPDLISVVGQNKNIARYEHHLRDLTIGSQGVREDNKAVRDPAFRRVVTDIYDYRCAATGLRVLLPDGIAMVEAAHIRPFSDTQDDDPRNGLALTPNMHWAFDKHLIAPGPDYKWHVSKQLDDRIPDFQLLTSLKGKALFLPKEKRMFPKQESLEWAKEKLM